MDVRKHRGGMLHPVLEVAKRFAFPVEMVVITLLD